MIHVMPVISARREPLVPLPPPLLLLLLLLLDRCGGRGSERKGERDGDGGREEGHGLLEGA